MRYIKSISFQFVCFHFVYLLHIYDSCILFAVQEIFLISTNANIIFFCGSQAMFISHVINIFAFSSRVKLYRIKKSQLNAMKRQNPRKTLWNNGWFVQITSRGRNDSLGREQVKSRTKQHCQKMMISGYHSRWIPLNLKPLNYIAVCSGDNMSVFEIKHPAMAHFDLC